MQLHERIGRRLKLRDLNIFLAVVKERSMSKAGAALAISQPAISKAIADMEYTLGAPLVDRTPYGIEPTLYGRALMKRSFAIFDELQHSVNRTLSPAANLFLEEVRTAIRQMKKGKSLD